MKPTQTVYLRDYLEKLTTYEELKNMLVKEGIMTNSYNAAYLNLREAYDKLCEKLYKEGRVK